jgi:5-formyltetrahydrofolate cyclo-ligase
MDDWEKIREWRRFTRIELLSRRLAIPPREKRTVCLTVYERLRERFPELRYASIGFYWPFKGEIDLRL